MVNQIVTVNVSQNIPPAPSTLQRTGAILSKGGTNTAPGTLSLITQISDLTPLVPTPKALSSLTWASTSGGTVTGTTAAPHGWTNGDIVGLTIAGAAPTGYNGNFLGTITGASTFTYPLTSNPGSETVPGTVTLGDVAELSSQIGTFFAQGSNLSIYVLELGETTATEGVAYLTTWIAANPGRIYSYLVPRSWDANAAFLTLLTGFNNTTSKTYFFITTTAGTYTQYTSLMKCAFTLVEASGIPATEFSCAAPFWVTLNYNPGSTNKVTPLAFSFLFGVTPYPTPGNAALLASLKAANVNVVGTGAEGGISNTILFWGHLMDGNPFNYWYSVDWLNITGEQALANAVINGSNNPLAPLLYDQQGINSLQDTLTGVVQNGVGYGLGIGTPDQTALPAAQFAANFEAGAYLGQLVVNAEPFLIYTSENPSDFGIGKYAGFAVTWTPGRGFEQIIVNISVTNFV